jgi:hypothetical protein
MANTLFTIYTIFIVINIIRFSCPVSHPNARHKKTPSGALPIFGVLRALMHDPENLNLVMLKPIRGDEWIAGYDYLTHPRLKRRTPHPDESLQVL